MLGEFKIRLFFIPLILEMHTLTPGIIVTLGYFVKSNFLSLPKAFNVRVFDTDA